jgi:hypothetical protein
MSCAIVRQVLGAFLDVATSKAMKWLEEEQTLKHVACDQPQGIATLYVSELVGQQTFLSVRV